MAVTQSDGTSANPLIQQDEENKMYNKLMNKNIILTILFSLFLALILFENTVFAEEEKKRGLNGTIDKDEIVDLFEQGKAVDGHIISGSDIIKIIKDTINGKTNYYIKITNSLIEGGLNFKDITSEPIDIQAIQQVN